ncbi:MAG: M3 family metallopeptidase [Candidatus Gracilibacteria bacterium]|nr:M3 family metallopeptidase [Candidatus Gracilibacteria bacterium]
MLELKNKIIAELNKTDFPNLEFLFSDEVLDISLDLLRELLKKEKEKFEKQLLLKNEELSFEKLFDNPEEDDNLDYFWSLLNHLSGVNDSEKIRNIIDTFEQEYQEFADFVGFNKDYYDKIVYISENEKLDEEQTRIVSETIKGFKLKGINLDEEKQNNIKEINLKLAEITNKFNKNCLDSQSGYEFIIEDFEIIKELPEDTLKLAKDLAKEKGINGWLFNADPTFYSNLMSYCSDKGVREKILKDRVSFASSGKYDNRGIILEILKLKQEKAKILGYKNYAEYSLESKMASNPEEVKKLIEGISIKAREKAKNEIKNIKDYFKLDNLEAWDFGYYETKFIKEKYQIDEKEIKKYFKLENVLDYLFDFVGKFYSLTLKEIKVPVYNTDVKVFEIWRKGKFISYYMIDLFYRKEKRAGAWADNLRSKDYSGEFKREPLIINCCNFQKQTESDTLLSIRDVETIFHEFGHALHEMLSESKYSALSGFSVEWDFVELPSQIHENWVGERESLKLLSKHHFTGESLSDEILDKFKILKNLSSGYFTIRQNEFALLDMMLYTLEEIPKNVGELDKITLDFVNKIGLFERGDYYKSYATFSHIFGGGYAAGYYSYMRAEILEAQAWEHIKENGIFNPEIGEKFISTLLGQGSRKDAKELFKDFVGKEVDASAFMKRKGLQD